MGKKRNTTRSHPVQNCLNGKRRRTSLKFIGEEPLLIRIEEKPYVMVMRTPGEEIFQAAGFCLGEGMVKTSDDFETINHDEIHEPNIIEVKLKPQQQNIFQELLDRQSQINQRPGYPVFRNTIIKDWCKTVGPVENDFTVSIDCIHRCVSQLSSNQKHYQTTRGSHAAIIFNRDLEMIAFSEDVGRHNALDKAIGRALMTETLADARLLVLSSRISFELVQKAARAGIPVVISESRPTSLAVEVAKKLNLTLAFSDRESLLTIVCGEERIQLGG